MAADFSTVPCQEVYGTAREERGYNQSSATVVLRCDWANRFALVADILGNFRPWPYSVGLYPTGAGTVPEEGQYTQDGQGMQYEHALVTVKYGVPGNSENPDLPDPQELASETLEPTAEFLTLDHNRFKWQNGDQLQPDEAPGWLKRGTRLLRTIFKVQTPLDDKLIEDLPGSVNDRQYSSVLLGLTFKSETLLFIPPKLSRTITELGVEEWNLQLAWEHNPNGWNRYWRYTTGDYERIWLNSKDPGADPPFESYPLEDQRPYLP